jgi:hypothetical protein
LKFAARTLVGLWLGLWTIAGVATFAGGLFILALQLYGYFGLGFWVQLSPASILRGFSYPDPAVPWQAAQKGIDCLLRLPLAAVFMWCGFHIAAMTWIARKNLERRSHEQPELIPAASPRFTALGISSLIVRRKR